MAKTKYHQRSFGMVACATAAVVFACKVISMLHVGPSVNHRRSICGCCVCLHLHSFHLVSTQYHSNECVCVSFLHDRYSTTTFLLLRKLTFLLLCFNKNRKNKSFTAHHQFVINIHLVSSVLCL